MEIIRFKAVSNCIGIRRKSIAYFLYNSNIIYDVSKYEHPLNSIKQININNNLISFLDVKDSNNDVISFKLKANSLGNIVEEVCYLDTKLMDINESNIELIKKNEKEIFDEDAGEYEFIIGYYYLNSNNNLLANEYFKKSLDLGFKLASLYYNN
jgi:hypothetical protein